MQPQILRCAPDDKENKSNEISRDSDMSSFDVTRTLRVGLLRMTADISSWRIAGEGAHPAVSLSCRYPASAGNRTVSRGSGSPGAGKGAFALPEGAGALRPMNAGSKNGGFSHGPFFCCCGMRLAPQETRTYFVTSVTAQRRRLFQVTVTAELLQRTILDYLGQGKFLLHAFVIMPDHFHALITPAADVSLEKAMQFSNGGFSFRLKSKLDVWMRGFNESQIMSAEKFAGCVRYIEENPVRKGLVSVSEEFPFSSAGRDGFDPMPSHLRG